MDGMKKNKRKEGQKTKEKTMMEWRKKLSKKEGSK